MYNNSITAEYVRLLHAKSDARYGRPLVQKANKRKRRNFTHKNVQTTDTLNHAGENIVASTVICEV